MKKEFISPVVEIVDVKEDIIKTSTTTDFLGLPDGEKFPW